MFAKLSGILDEQGADWAVVDVGGVGYLVSCSAHTSDQLPVAGEPVRLLIETHVREDRIQLFGFTTELEREWFRLLTTVQGVGTRVALALLGAARPERLATAIAAQDKTVLVAADGVGPKLAARILSELKDKAGLVAPVPFAAARARGGDTEPAGVNEDAISALVNLGYGRAEAFGAVATVAGGMGDAPSVDELIPAALRELAQ
ncbi:MAG: Holliday junction branch migration protein RuvA [Alphaproteobacteria bacterium]|nr:Holliday junction branch migration protein RuvA [Alphaproteobacteria bacterium]